MKALRLILGVLALVMVSLPAAALTYYDGSGQQTCAGTGGDQKIALAPVTNCIQTAIAKTTVYFLQSFSDYMRPIVYLFLGLVVTFFGVRMLWGEGEMKKKAFALLLKTGIVLMFSYNFGDIALQTFAASAQFQTVVVDTLQVSSSCEGDYTASTDSDAVSPGGIKVWAAMDCLLGHVLGYGPTFAMPSSIFGLLGSILGSGTFGATVFFIGVATFLSIVFMVLRVVYLFLTSYMFIGFLIIISPLIVPLLLLRATTPAFESWYRNLIAAIALPGLVFAYLCMVMPVLDSAIEGTKPPVQDEQKAGEPPPPPPQPTALTKVLGNNEKVESRYRNATQRCGLSMNSFDSSFTRGGSIDVNQVYNGARRNVLDPTRSGATDLCAQFAFPSADFGKNQMSELWKIGYSLIRLALTCYLITQMAGAIPNLSAALFSGGWGLLGAATQGMPFEQTLKKTVSGARTGLGTGGAGGALSGAGGGLLNGLMGR